MNDYVRGSRFGFPANTRGFLTPPVIWAAYFTGVYAVHGALCERTTDAGGAVQAVVLVITGAVVLAQLSIGVLALRGWRKARAARDDDDGAALSAFLAAAAAANAALFTAAVIWTGAPALMLEECGLP